MADFSNGPWNGDASKYADADDWCSACIIDENPSGQPKVKGLCKLPVRAPNGGAYNTNGIHAAAAALAGGRGGVQASPASKKAAAKKLVSMYASMNQTPPPSIKNMAQ